MKLQTLHESRLYKDAKNRLVPGDTYIQFIPDYYTEEQKQNLRHFWFVQTRLKFLRENLDRAARRENPQLITVQPDYVYNVGVEQGWKDPFNGEDLEFERGGEWGMKNAFGTGASNPRSCSIDRIDSSQGYIPGNIQLVTAKTNVSKGNMNNNEFIEYCKKVADYHK
jgi:hypothetical protein